MQTFYVGHAAHLKEYNIERGLELSVCTSSYRVCTLNHTDLSDPSTKHSDDLLKMFITRATRDIAENDMCKTVSFKWSFSFRKQNVFFKSIF